MDSNRPEPGRREANPDPDADELEVQRGSRARPGPVQPSRAPTPQSNPPPPADRAPAYVQPWLPDPTEPAPARPAPTGRIPERRDLPPAPPARYEADVPRPGARYADEPARPAPASNRGCLIVAGMAMVTALACALLFYGAIQSGIQRLTGFPSFSLPQPTPTIIAQPPIILRVQALSRLETQRYVMDTVVTAEEPGILPAPFTGDKILFLGHGEVVAGVDLGQMRPEDIIVYTDTGKVELHVPAAELFYVRLDNDQSRIYDRQTGVFTRADPNLETQVRQEAERQIRQTAVENGIMTQAQQNAEKTLRALLASLGYSDVTIIVKPPAAPAPATPTP